jgi:hypothetical protein
LLFATDAYQKLGGFAGMRDESKIIVWATMKSYPWEVVRMAMHTAGLDGACAWG